MKIRLKKLTQSGFDHVLVVLAFVVVFALLGSYILLRQSHAANTEYLMRMTLNDNSVPPNGLCLDDQAVRGTNGNPIMSWGCNSNDNAQKWTVVSAPGGFQIKNTHTSPNICVDDKGGAVQTKNGVANRIPVIAWQCNSADHAQIWSWSGGSRYGQLKNAYNNGCINDPSSSTSSQALIVYMCSGTGKTYFSQSQINTGSTTGGSGSATTYCTRTGNHAQDIANCARTQLNYWNANPSKHSQLIAAYCAGIGACENGEWCAGFVSYVLIHAGYSVGQHNLADDFENLASKFTFTSTPSVGAIEVSTGGGGGHVQVVVSTKPLTFISGNYSSIVKETSDTTGSVIGYAAPK